MTKKAELPKCCICGQCGDDSHRCASEIASPVNCERFEAALGESGADADCAKCGEPKWMHGLVRPPTS